MSINSTSFQHFDAQRVPSPCFVVDECAVEKNLQILQRVKAASGAKILLALKAFSMFSLAPLITHYLDGCCASGLYEAMLARHEFGGNKTGADKREVHVYSPAFNPTDFDALCGFVDHIVFNSFSQWRHFQHRVSAIEKMRSPLHCGLRINPMWSTTDTEIYDPCAPGSRLGITAEIFHDTVRNSNDLNGINGLHFHTLCEQGFAPLAQTLDVVEQQFGDYLSGMNWLNCGGGHHITQSDYDIDGLIERIKQIQRKYDLQVYLEPGEAIAINTGVLVSEVLDITRNQVDVVILDTSATCHMPDTLEMPYRADIFGAGSQGEKLHNYRLGGQTCLAGDVIGDYSFDKPLRVGRRLVFDDMAHYTMVKTTTFNGIQLPAIAIWNSRTDALRVVRQFGYQDFRQRLS